MGIISNSCRDVSKILTKKPDSRVDSLGQRKPWGFCQIMNQNPYVNKENIEGHARDGKKLVQGGKWEAPTKSMVMF